MDGQDEQDRLKWKDIGVKEITDEGEGEGEGEGVTVELGGHWAVGGIAPSECKSPHYASNGPGSRRHDYHARAGSLKFWKCAQEVARELPSQ